jgi:hypothetical protein
MNYEDNGGADRERRQAGANAEGDRETQRRLEGEHDALYTSVQHRAHERLPDRM